jgi:hypothetical protein
VATLTQVLNMHAAIGRCAHKAGGFETPGYLGYASHESESLARLEKLAGAVN